MSGRKSQVRERFRKAVFARDNNKCRMCGRFGALDAHHIIDRHELPLGGYVVENGIALCAACHKLAEEWHKHGSGQPEYAPGALFARIGSSKERVLAACAAQH